MSETVLVRREGSVCTITLNRPDSLNAFNLEMGDALLRAFHQVSGDASIRLVVLRGAGRAFSAGGDIKMIAQEDDWPAFFRELSDKVHETIRLIRRAPTVIAVCGGAVSGIAFGLATACDIRIITEQSTFHAGTTRLGLAPNGGLTYFLPRIIGRGRASRIILTGDKISAQQAMDWGLADSLVTSEELENEITHWSERLLAMAPLSQQEFKELLYFDDTDLAAHMDQERDKISISSGSEDFHEGITAFLEKRAPKFIGK